MGNVTSLEHLAHEFDGLFTQRVYRLESLDHYDAPAEHEAYAAFLAGKRPDPAWRDGWRRIAGGITASGREMARVHVVTEPVSDYIRFSLLHGYPANVEAGEDVRILPRDAAQAAMLPDLDYWLFDDSLAAVLIYDGAGTVQHVEWRSSPVFVESCCLWRDVALAFATPLAQYVAKNNITDERTAA